MTRNNSKATDYITKIFVNESSELKKIRESCEKKHMQIAPYEGQLIGWLLKVIGANRVLELGTLSGYSTAWIENSLVGENKLVISVEKSENHYKTAKQNIISAKLQNTVEIIHSDAMTVLKNYVENIEFNSFPLFDTIFIDAQKSEYIEYYSLAKKCIRSGGLIIADNGFLFGEIYQHNNVNEITDNKLAVMWKSINDFNQTIATDSEMIATMIPTTEGLVVGMKL